VATYSLSNIALLSQLVVYVDRLHNLTFCDSLTPYYVLNTAQNSY